MPPPVTADDDARAPLVLQIAHLRRRIAWLESRHEATSSPPVGEPPSDLAEILAADPDADATIHAFLEGVRADARLEAVTELTAAQAEAMSALMANERCLASVGATVDEIRAAADRPAQIPAVREALAWAVRQLERAMIASGPVVEEAVEAERERVLAAAVDVLGLEGLAAAEWVAAVNERVAAAGAARPEQARPPGGDAPAREG